LALKKLGENWNFDLSQVVGKNNFELNMKNTINTSLGGLNQYKFPDGVAQKQEIYDGTLGFLQATTNFDISRTIEAGFAKPINLAVGAEFRYENYSIAQGELTSYYNGNKISGGIQDGPSKGSNASAGCQCFPGWEKAVDVGRTNLGAYVDLETDIVERWTTAIAARFENYSDFGSTLTGKLQPDMASAKLWVSEQQ
jgi:iron complex outermembrane recepter protein